MNYGYTAEECLVTAGWLAATLFGLLALWATAGRFRWYWHVAPLALALAALVPMGGYQPLLIFGSQASGVVLYCVIAAFIPHRRDVRSEEPPRQIRAWRFTLLDGVLAILLAASVLAIVRNVPYAGDAGGTLDWWDYALTGLGFAAVTCAAYQLVAGWLSWYWRGLVTPLMLGAGIALLFAGDISEPFLPYLATSLSALGTSQSGDNYEWIVVLSLAQFWQTAIWLFFLRMAGWHWWPSLPWGERWALLNTNRWPKTYRAVHVVTRLALCFATLVLLGSVAEIYWNLLPPRKLPLVELPNSNGADDVEPVAKLVNWAAIPMHDPDEVDDFACSQFAEQNAEALRQIRRSLDKPWMREIDFQDSDTMLPLTESLGTWARVLEADARHQLALGRPDLAARDYVDIVRFSNLSGLGGASLDVTVADALRGIGVAKIVEHLDRFDEPTLREIAFSLELFAGPAEPLQLVWERDTLFQRYTTGWIGRLHYWAEHSALPQRPPTQDAVMVVRNRTDAIQRLAMLEAAIRAFRAQHDQLPPFLDALVPEYLAAVPADPFSGKPFRYRPTEDGYLLYSVGFDGYDDGGLRIATPDARRGEKQDLFLDSQFP
jgi:hypothetical protein